VYLPYCSRANTDKFLAYLGKLRHLCEELQCPNICFVRDFNAGTTNTFGGLLEDFCMENDFTISDYALLPHDTFTYISDAHNTTSWIDHRTFRKRPGKCWGGTGGARPPGNP